MTNIYEELALANQWTNDKLRSHLKQNNINVYELKTPYGTVAELILHVIDWINNWFNRIEQDKYQLKFTRIEGYLDRDKLFSEWEDADNRYFNFIKRTKDFESIVHYQDSEGKNQSLKLSAILLQLSHHFAIHRGHIALKLREVINKPAPPLEVVFWFLQGPNQIHN